MGVTKRANIISRKAASGHATWQRVFSHLWRWRVPYAGLLAIALAWLGEAIMRSGSAQGASTGIGVTLVQIAVVLAVFVAWVHDRLHLKRASSRVISGEIEATGENHASRFTFHVSRFASWRARLGWRGTLVGLALVGLLALWLFLLLRGSFRDLLAPWVWLAMLVILALTFVGVRPWPVGDTLLPNDPAEPKVEPGIRRTELLLLVAIIGAAALLRLVNLNDIPVGPYIDESGEALDARLFNRGQPVAGVPFSFFGTGWWGVPSFYFWLVAQSLTFFGDNLTGARTIHALMGIGTVWYTYRIGRAAWSPRAGLIAGALICVSDFAIQSSRTVTVSTTTQFFWTACFYYLYLAIKTRKPLHFALCGILAGFTLYGYASGKLLVLSLPLIALYLLARWGLTGVKRYLPGLVLIAVAAGLTFFPNALYQLIQDPAALTARYNTVTIFTPAEESRLYAQYGTDNWGLIIPQQFGQVYRAFDVGRELGPFYPTEQPILPVPWAALWVVGTAYMVFRLGDARFATLALWLIGGLAGSALTKDTPTLQRAVTMVPTLALIPAIFLDRVARGLPSLHTVRHLLRLRRSRDRRIRARFVHSVPNIAIAALVLLIALQTLPFYFGAYTAKAHYIEFTLAGRYIEQLDPERDIVYDGGTPVLFGDPSPLYFLAKDVPILPIGNASDSLPVTDNKGRDVHFLTPINDDTLLGALQNYYPGLTKTTLEKPDGTPVVAAFTMSVAAIDAQRMAAVSYESADGSRVVRAEPRLGTGSAGDAAISLPSLAYPAKAEWSGGLIVPAYGAYRLKLDAPAGARFSIEGKEMLATNPGSGAATEKSLVLAKGIHAVTLSGTLDGAQGRIELKWGSLAGELFDIGPQFLWGGGRGTILGQTYTAPTPGDPAWFTSPNPQSQTSNSLVPLIARRDSLFSWRNVNAALGGGTYSFGDWRGTLRVPEAGVYSFDARTSGRVSIWLDGEMAGIVNVSGIPNVWPATRSLSAGDHSFEIRFGTVADNSEFHLFWELPGGTLALLPPSAFTQADEGVWLAEDRPGAPGIDPSILGALAKAPAQHVATFSEGMGRPLTNPRGVGVDARGNVYVGDTGNKRIIVYAPDGKALGSWPSSPGNLTDPPPGEFGEIMDLAVGPTGVVNVLEATGSVQTFSKEGKLLRTLTPETLATYGPTGIAVDQDGTLHIADTGRHRILKVSPSPDGMPLSEVALPTATGGVPLIPLDQPFDVAISRSLGGSSDQPQDNVYLVDLKGRIIEITQSSGASASARQWPLPLTGFSGTPKLGVSPDGQTVYMTDSDRQRVAVHDVATGALSYFGERGAGAGQFGGPGGIAVGQDGRVYVLDRINGNVQVFVLSKPK